GVVALGRITGGGTEVAVVAGGTRGVVLVVARRGLGTCLLPPRAPGRVVVGVVLRGGAAVVGVVAEGVDRAGDVVQQGGGRCLAGAGSRDVTRTDEHRVARWWRRGRYAVGDDQLRRVRPGLPGVVDRVVGAGRGDAEGERAVAGHRRRHIDLVPGVAG